MTNEEFIQTYYKYPYAKITLGQFMNCVESYPTEEMPIRIEDVFSWRGIYDQPAANIEAEKSTKSENMSMLRRLLNETFMGWKGGTFYFCDFDEMHFETDQSVSTTEERTFILDFLEKNKENEFVKHFWKFVETL